nr:PREDICTED: arginine vasopressin-induced protein 1 [Anolis carolinensis]|eukprot:XP_008104731.1 PREDICTED: arginine vasopressin-induced protein 1 [Anolis carolinensis]
MTLASSLKFPTAQRGELPPVPAWREPRTMGTPASIVCDLPQHPTPKSCTRKRASANIFQGVDLWQLRRLFHSSGDAKAEERAQLIWQCAENRCITQALQQLHRRQRKRRLQSHHRPPSEKGSATRLLELQHFSRLRIEDHTPSCADIENSSNGKEIEDTDQTDHSTVSQHRKKRGMGAADYLHHLHR